jgi:DNA phosphorothioation-associated DGQHR protein 1
MPFPLQVTALRLLQPLGEFYLVSLKAEDLLQVAFSYPLRVSSAAELSYTVEGIQRQENEGRLKDIGRYIDTVEASFPNTIILGANYRSDGSLEDNETIRWKVKPGAPDTLVIPTNTPLAAIVDGQHRLHGFRHASTERQSMSLVCAVFLDLPQPYQAQLFATINFNQKKVDRSLAYELFGFNVEEESPESWAPEKLAVFIARKLNIDPSSPIRGRVKIAAQDDELLVRNVEQGWAVSMATIVDGVLRLFSSNPKRDRDEMHKIPLQKRRRTLLNGTESRVPLRSLYRETNDLAIFTAVRNYLQAAEECLWSRASTRSYIVRTVGVQALFDVLRLILMDFESRQDKDIRVDYFKVYIDRASSIDFADSFFQASGKGRVRIKNTIALACRLTTIDAVPAEDAEEYRRLTETGGTSARAP